MYKVRKEVDKNLHFVTYYQKGVNPLVTMAQGKKLEIRMSDGTVELHR